MLKVQEFLLEKGIDALKEELGIYVSKYEEHGIMSLNYSQIDSPKLHEVVRECRSLIVTIDPPHNVVSRAFDRFYNYGECPLTDQFEINNYIGWEKLDGSIISFYHHNDQWNVATRKMAFAEGINQRGYCFKDIFDKVFDYGKVNYIDKSLTLIFELVSPLNRIVKLYENNDIYLTGVRNKVTGREFNLNELQIFAKELNFKLPKIYKFNNKEEIFKSLEEIDPFDEGFVFVNYENNHRLKIKNPSYMAIAHLRDNGFISPKRISLLVWANDTDEYLNSFPEDREFFDPYIYAFNKMKTEVYESYNKYKHLTDRKEFALTIKDLPIKHFLFSFKNGKTFEDIANKTTDDNKLALLQLYKGE
jgi:hypothetical protein